MEERSKSEILREKRRHKLVSVDSSDKTARVFVVCDVGRVFGENVAYKLVNRL